VTEQSDRNPYAPPRAVISDAPESLRLRPRSVVVAVVLRWIVFAVSVAWVIYRFPQDARASSTTFVIAWSTFWMAVTVVITVNIWWGRNWARILALVFALLSVLAVFYATRVVGNDIPRFAFIVLGTAIEVAAVVLLFGPGRAWFRRSG
jgi:hypothetical protein